MSQPETQEPLDALIFQWLEAHRTGKRLECDALVAAHPELSAFSGDYEQLDQRFAPLRRLTGTMPKNAAEIATMGACDTAVVEALKAGTSFGDYDLLSEIARGGMGVVYKARQRSLNRIVALKMVLGEGHRAVIDRQRFLVEARAVARLCHPQIVPIYEVGERQGQPYFTMEYFAGGCLRERMDKLRGDARAIAALMATVAKAVEHAHRRGILHRDLKPSNVLLDERGEPHVTDFGLAKQLDEESDLTQAGTIVGTPSYMAPEQADGHSDLSTAADVYGLGAILYELLTGRPPFKANTPMETMLQVMSTDPKRPRDLDRAIDPDLETICLKCLEKDPLARYGTSEAMADDLERWLAGEPIHARPATSWERAVKWSRRQPVLAASLGTMLATLLALLIIGGFSWQNAELRAQAVKNLGQAQVQLAQVNGERQRVEQEKTASEKLAAEQTKLADQQKALAEKIAVEVKRLETAADTAKTQLSAAQREARSTLYAADMQLAHAAWLGENITTTGDLLSRYRTPSGQEDPRGFEWFYLNRQLHGARLAWRDTPTEKAALGSIVGMAVSPDGKTLATAQIGNTVKLWNLTDGKLLRTIETHKTNIQGMSFTNLTGVFFEDEGRKVTAVIRKAFDMRQMDKAVAEAMAKQVKLKIESLGDGFEFQTCTLADGNPMRVQPFDANRVRTSVFPVMTGGFFMVDDGSMLMVNAMDTSPDGRFIALVGAETKVAGGDMKHPGRINGGSIIVWDAQENKIHARQKSPVMISAVAFSPVGDALAIATSDGAVGIGKRDLAQPPKLLLGHQGMIYSLKFNPAGTRLASGGLDGLVLLWDAADAKELVRLRGHMSAISRIEFTPDGRTLISGGLDGTVKVWDWERAGPSTVLRGHESAVGSLTFSSDGSEILSADLSGNMKVRRSSDGHMLREEKRKLADASMIRISNSGRTMAWKDGFGDWMTVRDIASGKETKLIWKDHLPFHPTLSSDEKLVAASDLKGKGLCIWNIAEGKLVATLDESEGLAMGLTFSSDNKLLAVGQGTGVVLWDWQAGPSGKKLEGKEAVADPAFELKRQVSRILEKKDVGTTAVAFSADNRFIAAAAGSTLRPGETSVRIWDLAANRLHSEFVGAGQMVRYLAFSPDGRRLVTGGTNSAQRGILKLWDTTSGREVFSVPLPAADLTAIALSPDGHRLAAALSPLDLTAMINNRSLPPGEIHIWDATPPVDDNVAADDTAQLQGTWIVTSAELNGASAKSSEGDQLTFDEGQVVIGTKVRKTEPVAFRVDATQQPKQMELDDKPAIHAIYEFQGAELILCYSEKRPTAFDSKQGLLLKLQRKP